jgi:predicted negative regulator of RcsB-dependent stress response
MANELIDEHEQGERVRQWLRDNATAIGGGIAVGLSLIFGWQWWQRAEVERQVTAATQYQALVEAVDARDSASIESLADKIRKDHGKTAYAALAAMQQAEEAVRQGKLEAAETHLQDALKLTREAPLQSLIAIRLARVELQLGRAEQALSRLDSVVDSRYAAIVAELRGDLLQRLGRRDEARSAYADALAALDAGSQTRFLVEMKLADAGGSPDAES